MAERIITARDACTRFCSYGVKAFCRSNGLDYLTFLKKGYPESVLRQTGDTNVIAALDEARDGRK